MQLSVKRQCSDQLAEPLIKYALWINIALSSLMMVVAVLLFHPVFEWAWQQIMRPDRQYHLLVSVAFVALCGFRLFQEKRAISFARPNVYAMLLVCVACAAYLLNQHFVQFNAVSVALFLLFWFGLLGHFVSAQTWRSCVLPLFLALLVLPFEGYLDIFLGFPMRLLSAEAAVAVLHSIGVASISSDTVLLIDNRAAIVDIDCSGIRGFWIGSIFFCAITWIERYRMNLRWLFIAIVAAALLFLGNALRIVALVVLDILLNKSALAQLVHESLGLLSFALVMLLSWQLLRLYAERHEPMQRRELSVLGVKADSVEGAKSFNEQMRTENTSAVSKTTLLLSLILFGFGLLQVDEQLVTTSTPVQDWALDFNEQHYSDEPLNAVEKKFFNDNGAQAYKFASTVGYAGTAYKASVLVVVSGHWKAQHIPEHCYVAQGYKISASRMQQLGASSANGDVSFRQLDLVKNIGYTQGELQDLGSSPAQNPTQSMQSFTSDYWFQSNNQSTVNYSRRVLSQLRHPEIPWAMVSVLWYEGVPSQARQQLLLELRETVTRKMNHHG